MTIKKRKRKEMIVFIIIVVWMTISVKESEKIINEVYIIYKNTLIWFFFSNNTNKGNFGIITNFIKTLFLSLLFPLILDGNKLD